jgi:hypothetical protein
MTHCWNNLNLVRGIRCHATDTIGIAIVMACHHGLPTHVGFCLRISSSSSNDGSRLCGLADILISQRPSIFTI